MKYIVVVNQKYLINVDAESNGGAEHRILDNFKGIDGAQAFSPKEFGTEYFQYFLETCSTVSPDELRAMSNNYEAKWTEYANAKAEIANCNDHIEKLEHELRQAKADLELLNKFANDRLNLAVKASGKIGHKVQ